MLGQGDFKTAFWNQLHLHRMQHFCFWIACHIGNALLFFYCILYQMFIGEVHTSGNMLVFGISRILANQQFGMHCPSQYQTLNSVCPAAGADKKLILFFQPARIQLPFEEVQDSCRTNSWGTRVAFSESHSHHACEQGSLPTMDSFPCVVCWKDHSFPDHLQSTLKSPMRDLFRWEKNSVKLSDSSVWSLFPG